MSGEVIPQNYKETNSDIEWTAWELQDDLSTVSCYAACEVDNLITGRQNGIKAIKHLVEMIRNSLIFVDQPAHTEYMVDPATAVAMGQALECSYPDLKPSIQTLDGLINEAKKVTDLLEQITQNPEINIEQGKQEELRKLRSLCLTLSRSALAHEEPIEDRE
jgi:hypothetical protein